MTEISESPGSKSEASVSRVYFRDLDGIRTLSFLAVFFYHSFSTDVVALKESPLYRFIKWSLFGNGNLGVNCFFVLSGFLITFLLLEEKRVFRRVDLKRFYLRRFLRIWPLYYACVLFGFLIFPQLKSLFGGAPNEGANPWVYIVFLNNFDFIYHGSPDASILAVLWSVAIEEQFYLFWPLLFVFLPAKFLSRAFWGLIVASFLFRFLNWTEPSVLEMHTLSCISDLTVGGFFAAACHGESELSRRLKKAGSLLTAVIWSAVLLCFFWRMEIFSGSQWLVAGDRLVLSFLFGLLIVDQVFNSESSLKLGRLPGLTWLGKYTYGLYCLHMVGILVVATVLSRLNMNRSLFGLLVLEGGLSLLLTFVMAYVSYHWWEQPFLKLKKRFTKIPSGGGGAP